MHGKSDGKKHNHAPRGNAREADEPWLGSGWSLAVFIAAEVAIGAAMLRLTAPEAPSAVAAQRAPHGLPAPQGALAGADQVAQWVVASGDAGRRPFIVVDKPRARVLAYDASGRLTRSEPVLLGLARGDDSVPGIGDRPMAQITPEERITPAGRFVAQLGTNLTGEDIVWIDYDAAVSMHRVRATKASEQRLERLASESIDDNRISYGCINLPVAFYEQVLRPMVEAGPTVVYVLPDQRPLHEVFALGQRASRQAL